MVHKNSLSSCMIIQKNSISKCIIYRLMDRLIIDRAFMSQYVLKVTGLNANTLVKICMRRANQLISQSHLYVQCIHTPFHILDILFLLLPSLLAIS
jgi:hypothetical protein